MVIQLNIYIYNYLNGNHKFKKNMSLCFDLLTVTSRNTMQN